MRYRCGCDFGGNVASGASFFQGQRVIFHGWFRGGEGITFRRCGVVTVAQIDGGRMNIIIITIVSISIIIISIIIVSTLSFLKCCCCC